MARGLAKSLGASASGYEVLSVSLIVGCYATQEPHGQCIRSCPLSRLRTRKKRATSGLYYFGITDPDKPGPEDRAAAACKKTRTALSSSATAAARRRFLAAPTQGLWPSLQGTSRLSAPAEEMSTNWQRSAHSARHSALWPAMTLCTVFACVRSVPSRTPAQAVISGESRHLFIQRERD